MECSILSQIVQMLFLTFLPTFRGNGVFQFLILIVQKIAFVERMTWLKVVIRSFHHEKQLKTSSKTQRDYEWWLGSFLTLVQLGNNHNRYGFLKLGNLLNSHLNIELTSLRLYDIGWLGDKDNISHRFIIGSYRVFRTIPTMPRNLHLFKLPFVAFLVLVTLEPRLLFSRIHISRFEITLEHLKWPCS